MRNLTAVLELKNKLDSTDDAVLVSMSARCAKMLKQSGNSHAAAYVLSLPRDTPRFTAQEIRNTLIQQAKIDLSPQYIQFEVCKRRNDNYNVLCAQLSAHPSSWKRRTSTAIEWTQRLWTIQQILHSTEFLQLKLKQLSLEKQYADSKSNANWII